MPGCDPHVALGVEIDLAPDQFAAGVVADRHEHAGGGQLGGLAGLRVAQGETCHAGLAVHLDDLGVEAEVDLLVGLRPLEHDA